ncbi:V-type ATP synthase subunit F [Nanoarchaeota archaeon]
MREICVVGGGDFVLGFALSGIKRLIEIDEIEQTANTIKELMSDKSLGIILVDEKLMTNMDARDREDLEASADPVIISLSTEASQESLRKLIKKSIGIDLMADD